MSVEHKDNDITVTNKIDNNGILKKVIIKTNNYFFDTSLMNAIRRTILDSDTYALSPFILQEYKPTDLKFHDEISQVKMAKELYNRHIQADLFPKEMTTVIHSVLQSSSINTQLLSHRISRIPISNTDTVRKLLENPDYSNFCIVISSSDGSPVTAMSIDKLDIYSEISEFLNVFCMYKGSISMARINLLGLFLSELFKCKILIVTLKKNESILAISFIQRNYEKLDSRFSPCLTRYRYIPYKSVDEILSDDEIYELMSYVNQKKRLDNKNGTKVPEGDIKFNYFLESLFEQPLGLELTIEYNYKLNPRECLIKCVKYLINQLELFRVEYLNPGSIIVLKKSNEVPFMQIITVLNGDTELNFQFADHTLGNLISSYLLYDTVKNIISIGNNEKILLLIKNLQISYKKVHPLIDEVEIQYLLPFNIININIDLYNSFFNRTATKLTDEEINFMNNYRNNYFNRTIDTIIYKLNFLFNKLT